jgi:hypothetical protein
MVHIIQSQMIGRLTNNELGRMWKESKMTQFKMLSRNLEGEVRKNNEKLGQDSQSRGLDFNQNVQSTKEEC